MSPDDFRRDMLYHAALSIGTTLLEKKLLSQKEFTRVKKLLLKKYDPYLGKLLSRDAYHYVHPKRPSDQNTNAVHKHVTVI
jgi:hypothetical protein